MAAMAVLVLALCATLVVAHAGAVQQRVSLAADLGALAGAQARVSGLEPCTVAARVVTANGARTVRCAVLEDDSVQLDAEMTWTPAVPWVAAHTITVRSRAGPAPAEAGSGFADPARPASADPPRRSPSSQWSPSLRSATSAR